MKTRIARFAQLTALPCAALLLSPVATQAIGPDTQIITDANAVAAPKLNDVCAIGYTDGNGNFSQIGTGTAIGYQFNGTNTVFSIVTAAHVAFDPRSQVVLWGSGNPAGTYGGTYLMGANVTGAVGSPDPNPVTGAFQDIALIKASVTFSANNAAAGKNQLLLVQNNLVNVQPFISFGLVSLDPYFTEVGYGTAGVWNPPPPAPGFYAPVGGYDDARRYQNNGVTGINGAGLVTWTYAAKGAAGGGASFGGDSGGPYLFATPSTTGKDGTPVNYSDDEEVVHVAGDVRAGGNKLVGDQGYGEPLVETGNPATGSWDWVDQYTGASNNAVCAIPEPSAAGLLVVGLGFCLARRRSKT